MPQRLRTLVSQASWCASDGDFQPAQVAWMGEPDTPVYWLDQLLEGGIILPDVDEDRPRALTILVTGPPGSGKSTLAFELCYRWTDGRLEEIDRHGACVGEARSGLSSLYVTSESDDSWLRQKAQNLGWNLDRRFWSNDRERAPLDAPMITVWPTADLQSYLVYKQESSGVEQSVFESLTNLFKISVGPAVKDYKDQRDKEAILGMFAKHTPNILVIDSLNTVDRDDRSRLFKKFTELTFSGPRIVLVVIESENPEQSADFWEYLADVVIRIDRRHVTDYLVRNIEIVKARYQSHIWGTHQLKIYGPPTIDRRASIAERRRAHPYRADGGIAIFPSIHYYLSVYKRLSPDERPLPFRTPLKRLNNVLGGGLPEGRCTGFYGVRGGHKSHLGYHALLDKILRAGSPHRALVISLRDDEGLARKTMETILRQEFSDIVDDPAERLRELELQDRLEILYYPPGYITPEEFFHRMFVSVQRMKATNSETNKNLKLTVLFNSLDQLSSRFPLCAREQIFIPGIIETLTAEGVTSIFIAVEEPGQPPEQYGLLSMADALISFQHHVFSRDDYLGHLRGCLDYEKRLANKVQDVVQRLGERRQPVVLKVVRFAGGQEAGAGGILELVDNESSARFQLYGQQGLHFVPFSADFSRGERVEPADGG